MMEAARQLGEEFQFVLPVASTLDFQWAQNQVHSNRSPDERINTTVSLTSDAIASLYFSRAGIVASGTATVEAAIMGTPFVMVYRVSPLTYALGKSSVNVAHYAMVNLIAEKEVVPELVQASFTGENIVAELRKIIPDGEPRTRMIQELADVKARLKRGNGGVHPSEATAAIILEMIAS